MPSQRSINILQVFAVLAYCFATVLAEAESMNACDRERSRSARNVLRQVSQRCD